MIKKYNIINSIIFTLSIVVLVLIDFFTKQFAIENTPADYPNTFIPGIIDFQYLENKGMAWGFLQNQTQLLFIISIIVSAILLVLMFIRSNDIMFCISSALIIAGGIGNSIDRISNGYVVDFIRFHFWQSFPTFNFADICVTVGGFLLVLYVILHKEVTENNNNS